MKLKLIVLLMLGMTAAYSQTTKKKSTKPVTKTAASPKSAADGLFATIETNKGNIVIELAYKSTPVTVANFVSLAEGTNTIVNPQYKGKPFFDGLKFHRVIKDFMIQGGDPMGTGGGDPGYKFKDEITEAKFDKPGILAMANAGPFTNGSQFFITHKDTPWLNGKHTIFGYVTSGQDVVNAIAQDDIIKKVTIARKGAEAKAFDASKVFDHYYNVDRPDEESKMAAIKALAQKQQDELAANQKKEYLDKYGPVIKSKMDYFTSMRKKAIKTPSGLEYVVVKKGTATKPADGTPIFFHYAGYFEDGLLFDSSYADVNTQYGKYDERRDQQTGYNPYPFTAGQKTGMIAGFIEALSLMNIGDKVLVFIPSELGYGAAGRAPLIPGNTNLIFEMEIFDKLPEKK